MNTVLSRNKSIGLGILLLLILLGLAGVAFFRPWDVTTYEGKTAADWLELLNSGKSEERTKAAEAIRMLGTNAFPTLERYLSAEDYWWKKKLIDLAMKQSILKLSLKSASEMHALGRRGYSVLGPDSIPSLIHLLNDPQLLYSGNPANNAANQLSQFGSASLPALVGALTNDSPYVRYHACFCLGWFENLRSDSAVDPLVDRLNDPEWYVRCRAALALESLHRNPAVVVPALARRLSDERSIVRYRCARALGKFGAAAHAAAPLLLSARQNEGNFPQEPSKAGVIGSKSHDEVTLAIETALTEIQLQ